ncbi:hypothetical protein [Streptomyces sp. NPDC058548]|uniref:hypothetical protein n=1 Tax=Streptomyces sp. NPDC058548 TaxID=3346545 RepID=UPI0036692CFC
MAALSQEGFLVAAAPTSSMLTLPSPRASTPKQLDGFIMFAVLSGAGRRLVSSQEISATTKSSQETTTGILSFLISIGLVEGSRGTYALTREGWGVAETWQQDKTQGRLMLQGMFLSRWPARVAFGILRDGPVPQEEFVQRLLGDMPGQSRRGRYLVDWLVLSLVVQRDAALTVTASSALLAAAHHWQDAAEAKALLGPPLHPREGALMGMTYSELRALPARHYMAVLKNVIALGDVDATD